MLSGIRRLSKSGSKKDATDGGGERLTFSITRADGTFGVGLSDSNYITSIEEGTPAASTGLMPGDLIVAVNGEDLDGRKVTNVMAKSPDLETIKLTVERRPPPTQRKGSLTDRMPKLSLSGRASGAEVISESSDPDIQRTLSTMMPGETMVSIRLTRAQARAQFGAQFGLRDPSCAQLRSSAQFSLTPPRRDPRAIAGRGDRHRGAGFGQQSRRRRHGIAGQPLGAAARGRDHQTERRDVRQAAGGAEAPARRE